MVSISNPLVASITVYAIIIMMIVNNKPLLLFTEDERIREFGFEDDETIFPLHVISVLIAIFIYLIMNIYASI